VPHLPQEGLAVTLARNTLLWTPRAKERPRSVIHGTQRMTFTPKSTRDAEAALAAQWVGKPIEGPIMVGLSMSDTDVIVSVATVSEPASRKLRRGDIDNYCKTIIDALNGVAWLDDRQIAILSARKV
jgi:Holliday junction resolvase RusA-like endonuclease